MSLINKADFTFICPTELEDLANKHEEFKKIGCEIYDINHFGEKKQKYNVMSVPCLVINEDKIFFGKKNIEQILDLI